MGIQTYNTALYPQSSYNLNPQPQQGQGAYGAVPGAIGVPPSTWQEMGQVLPGLDAMTGQTSQDIQSQLAGQVSPSTQGMLKDAAATWGVKSGMPSGGQSDDYFLRSLGITSEALQNQGIGNYNSTTKNIASMQTNPALAAEIASSNATLAAAPNPTQAADAQMAAWRNGMAQTSGSGASRSPGGGTGVYSTPSPTGTQSGGSGGYYGGGGGYYPAGYNWNTVSGAPSNQVPAGETYGANGEIYDANGNMIGNIWDETPGAGTGSQGLTMQGNQVVQPGSNGGNAGGFYVDPTTGAVTSYDPHAWDTGYNDVMGNPADVPSYYDWEDLF